MSDALPTLFPLGMMQQHFIEIDVMEVYSKILTDVFERTDDLPDQFIPALFDSPVKSESCHGLIHRLSKAMALKLDLFLVYDTAVNLLREATADEKRLIEDDYKKMGASNTGAYISFSNFHRSDMLRLYSALEYHTVSALNKSMNLSKAVQIKISDLRKSVSLVDSNEAKTQAMAIASGLAQGKDVLLDAGDSIVNSVPDLTAIKTSIEFLNHKRAFYLGMPSSYINGILNSGLGDTGQADTRAIERGLRNYFFSIVRPVCSAVFGVETKFQADDFGQIINSLEALKTFSITDDELISQENKREILNKMLGLSPDEQGDNAPASIEATGNVT